MANVLVLPSELLTIVGSYLICPDLDHFCDAKLVFNHACRKRLHVHKRLQRIALALAHRRAVPQLEHLKNILCTILRNPDAAGYIVELKVGFDAVTISNPLTWNAPIRDYCTAEEKSLITEAVRGSPMATEIMIEEDIFQVLAIDDFALADKRTWILLALILPMLYNLRSLGLVSSNVDPVPGYIVKTLKDSFHSGEMASSSCPLGKLEQFEATWVEYGITAIFLSQCLGVAELTNVRANFEDVIEDLSWPRELPKSKIRHLTISGCALRLEQGFALAAGLAGPCTIYHEASDDNNSEEGRYDWNYIEIPYRDAPQHEWRDN